MPWIIAWPSTGSFASTSGLRDPKGRLELEAIIMLAGYCGRVLHVDLSTGHMQIENPTDAFYRTYLGGLAMGLAYLLRTTAPKADPLGPENVLTFMLSAPTGAAVSGQSRMCANARSPLTGGIGDAQCGGFFPAELK